MADVVIAPSQADARAAEAVEQHHAQLSGVLAAHAERLIAAVAGSAVGAAEQARAQLADWCEQELIPHARAEEQALYPRVRDIVEGRLLVDGMIAEHEVIAGLVQQLRTADPVRAAATATALRVVFDAHLAKENELIVPLLQRTPGVGLADLLAGMRGLLGERAHPEAESTGPGGSGHSCSCGQTDEGGHPELDARTIPHAIRHATIFGALETVRPGSGLVLLAPHDPVPLLAQVAERWPGRFTVDYLERGPQTWRLLFSVDAA